MVLSTSELIASLRTEVRILLHLARKVDNTSRDYRPTPAQRSTLELVRHLSGQPGLNAMNLWSGVDATAAA